MKYNPLRSTLRQVRPTYSQVTDDAAYSKLCMYNMEQVYSHYKAKANACGLTLEAYCVRFGIKLPKIEVSHES